MLSDTKVTVDQLQPSGGETITVLRFEGDITSNSRIAVLGTYQGLEKDAARRILLDFSGVHYLNSSGIGLVIQMVLEAGKAGQVVKSFGLTPHFQKVFTMVGLARFTTLHADEASACEAFQA